MFPSFVLPLEAMPLGTACMGEKGEKPMRLACIAAFGGICLTVLLCGWASSATPPANAVALGFSQTVWRQSLDEFRLDIAFPLAIGAEVVPVPPGKQGPPLSKPTSAGVADPPEAADLNAYPTRESGALLTVHVPYHAKVTLNGLETQGKGSQRRYVACGLTPGLSYEYVIEAQVVREGKVLKNCKTVVVSAGVDGTAVFAFAPAPCETRSDPELDPLQAIPEFRPPALDSLPGLPGDTPPDELEPFPGFRDLPSERR